MLPILSFNKSSHLFMAVFKKKNMYMQGAIDGILNIVCCVTVGVKT